MTSWRPSTHCETSWAATGMSGRSASNMRVFCAEYEDGSRTKGEVAVDKEQTQGRRIIRTWLDPEVGIHSPVAKAIQTFDAVIIGPGSFFTSLMPILLVNGVPAALRAVSGPDRACREYPDRGTGHEGVYRWRCRPPCQRCDRAAG